MYLVYVNISCSYLCVHARICGCVYDVQIYSAINVCTHALLSLPLPPSLPFSCVVCPVQVWSEILNLLAPSPFLFWSWSRDFKIEVIVRLPER